mgnify:FL=1
MRTRYFQTCEELNAPELIYIRDVEWAYNNWDALIASPGVIIRQKPHFISIGDPNLRLLFLMRWANGKEINNPS